jgi:hypothetical protein
MSWTRIESDEDAADVVEAAVDDALDAVTQLLDADLDLSSAARARLLDQASRQLHAYFTGKVAALRRRQVH